MKNENIIFFVNLVLSLSFHLKFTHLWQNQFVDQLFMMTFVDVVHFSANRKTTITFILITLLISVNQRFLWIRTRNQTFPPLLWTILSKINELYYRSECEKQLHFIFTNQNNGHDNPTKKRAYFWFALTFFNYIWHNYIWNSFIG